MYIYSSIKKIMRQKKKSIKENLSQRPIIKQIKYSEFGLKGTFKNYKNSQDTKLIIKDKEKNFNVLAIFDGNGKNGQIASNYISDFTKKFIETHKKEIKDLKNFSETKKFLEKLTKSSKKSLKKSSSKFKYSGTTALIILITQNFLTITNIGNSKAVLCRLDKETKSIELNHAHSTKRLSECRRIKNLKGQIRKTVLSNQKIGPKRAWVDNTGPGFTCTRNIGNFGFCDFIFCSDSESDFIYLKKFDRFLILGSDGLWDVMGSEQAVGFVREKMEVFCYEDIAKELVMYARRIWEVKSYGNRFFNEIGDTPDYLYGIDDITVIIVFFEFESSLEDI